MIGIPSSPFAHSIIIDSGLTGSEETVSVGITCHATRDEMPEGSPSPDRGRGAALRPRLRPRYEADVLDAVAA